MSSSVPPIVVLTLGLALSPVLLRAECIWRHLDGTPAPAPYPAPTKVTGRICGSFIVPGLEGAPELMRGDLTLEDDSAQVVAKVSPSANQGFEFPVMPPGRYRIRWLTGFAPSDLIEVRRTWSPACETPVRITFRIGDECDWYSRVSRRRQ
jgi:hypothetical protein